MKRMKSARRGSPNGIPVEVWRCLGERALEFLTTVLNTSLGSERMCEEWRRSVLCQFAGTRVMCKAVVGPVG